MNTVQSHSGDAPPVLRSSNSRFAFYAPLALFLVIAVFLGIGLTLDPRKVPSPLIGKSVPEFALPAVLGRSLGLASTDLKKEVSLVNVFASWCVECRVEHPLWMQIKREGRVPLHGLNYKDRPQDASKWLDELGDPYVRTGADINGRVSIDWGVYGVPETFVVDRDGRIAYKYIGAVTREVWEKTLWPLIDKLQRAPASG